MLKRVDKGRPLSVARSTTYKIVLDIGRLEEHDGGAIDRCEAFVAPVAKSLNCATNHASWLLAVQSTQSLPHELFRHLAQSIRDLASCQYPSKLATTQGVVDKAYVHEY